MLDTTLRSESWLEIEQCIMSMDTCSSAGSWVEVGGLVVAKLGAVVRLMLLVAVSVVL